MNYNLSYPSLNCSACRQVDVEHERKSYKEKEMSQNKKKVPIDQSVWLKLDPVARARNQSTHELIREILEGFLVVNQVDTEVKTERRVYRRKEVVLPAMIYEQSTNGDMGRYFSATIVDVSIGGARLAFPLDRKGRIKFLSSSKDFEIVCYFPDSEVLCRFKCNPKYLAKNDGNVQVGAAFSETGPESFEPLSNFLAVE